MPLTLDELKSYREDALNLHSKWKSDITARDLIASDNWSTTWDDGSTQNTSPMVENVYIEALEDKVMTAGSLMPKLVVWPRRGTRADKAERNAEKRRRAMVGYWNRSNLEVNLEQLYFDYLHSAAAYLVPWADFYGRDGQPLPSSSRFPYFQRVDPRQAYPLSHNTMGRLTSLIIRRSRKLVDVEQEYGVDHPALRELVLRASRSGRQMSLIEELWHMDESSWAVAFFDPGVVHDRVGPFQQFIPPRTGDTGAHASWVRPPEPHRLGRCPVVEARPPSHDGSYRSPLEAVIPQLRVAHDIMARVLDDLGESIYAPVAVRNIDATQFGPGAVLEAKDDAQPIEIAYGRPPTNFEATQKIIQKLGEARRQARHPEQRQGEAGASIVSDKGLRTLQGAFNTELASAQKRMAHMLSDATQNAANFDEVWCAGEKAIEGTEDGKAFDETYDPVALFGGDYRNEVSFGAKLGLDENSSIIRLSAAMNMGGLSVRSFMRQAGFVDDPLQEERERGLEEVLEIGKALLMAQASQGNPEAWAALHKYFDEIDSDKTTHRVALRDAILSITSVTPAQASGLGGPPDAGAAVGMARSMASGGIPGNAAGQPRPSPSPELLAALPPGVAQAMSEITPGGTAA